MEQAINRVNEAIQQWKQSEKEHELLLPELVGTAASARIKLRELQIIRARFKNSTAPAELRTLKFLDGGIRRWQMEKQRLEKIEPKNKFNWRNVIFHIFSRIRYNLTAAKLNKQEKKRTDNFIQTVQRSGFSQYAQDLQKMIQSGKKNFTYSFPYHSNERETTNFKLNIGYDEVNGHHFKNIQASYFDKMRPGDVRQHQFSAAYDNLGPNVTANLMAGRAIYDYQNGWRQLDLTDKDSQGNYSMKTLFSEGFDVEEACKKLPIWDKLSASQQATLPEKLGLGDRHGVTFEHLGAKNTVFLEANPSKQGMLAFNNKGKRIDLEKMFATQVGQKLHPQMTVVKSPNQTAAKSQANQEQQQVKHRIKIRSAHKVR